MPSTLISNAELAEKLFTIGAIHWGSFTLRSGIVSPIYIDLRLAMSHPNLLEAVAKRLEKLIEDVKVDLICPVPYTALPFATAMSLSLRIPMIMKRKEIKSYGTKKVIEGCYQKNQSCIVVEDLVTTGSSVLETTAALHDAELVVKRVISVIDREQGGKDNLNAKGLPLFSLLSMNEILDFLKTRAKP